MTRLRQARTLACLVLAWFALTLGVAFASPAVNPQVLQMVCGGNGTMKMVALQGDGVAAEKVASSHTLDCPLCTGVAPPPPVARSGAQPQPLAHAVQSIPAARLAARIAAPLPARGPPALG